MRARGCDDDGGIAMTLTVWSIDGAVPVVDPTAYVHPTAVLIGDVIIGPGCYIGPTACLRGDFGRLHVRAGANVQDGCILHAYPGVETVVEEDGHIGHGAVLHGCTVGRNALVGMNAVDQRWRRDRRVGGGGGDGVREGGDGRSATHAGRRHPGARAALADGRRARVESGGHGELPGAHAPQFRLDARHDAARSAGTGSPPHRAAGTAAALDAQGEARLTRCRLSECQVPVGLGSVRGLRTPGARGQLPSPKGS